MSMVLHSRRGSQALGMCRGCALPMTDTYVKGTRLGLSIAQLVNSLSSLRETRSSLEVIGQERHQTVSLRSLHKPGHVQLLPRSD